MGVHMKHGTGGFLGSGGGKRGNRKCLLLVGLVSSTWGIEVGAVLFDGGQTGRLGWPGLW